MPMSAIMFAPKSAIVFGILLDVPKGFLGELQRKTKILVLSRRILQIGEKMPLLAV